MHEMTKQALAEDPTQTFVCGCCDKTIKNVNTMLWVEMSTSGEFYRLPGGVPEGEESQGCFPMGATCYRKSRKT